MITQTLEWYRFGEKQPEVDEYCLMTFGGVPPKLVRLHSGDEWRSGDGQIFNIDDTDLWAYWSEPKEEGK